MRAAAAHVALLAAITLCLLLPALWNGAPFVWYDGISYFDDAKRGVIPLYAPTFYAQSFSLLTGAKSIWHWQALIALLTVIVLDLFWESIAAGRVSGAVKAVILGGLALVSPLAFEASYLMPDFAAGALISLLAIQLGSWDSLSRGKKISLALLSGLLISFHLSHLWIAAGLAGLKLCLALKKELRRDALLAAAAVAAQVAAVALLISARNSAYLGTGKIAPLGGLYLFARFFDGPLRADVAEICAEGTAPQSAGSLCERLADMPSAPSAILWHCSKSAMCIQEPGVNEREKAAILFLRESITRRPGEYLKEFLANGTAQIFKLTTDTALLRGLSLCDSGVHAERCERSLEPAELHALRASKQARQELPYRAIQLMYSASYWIGIVLSVAFLGVLARRRDGCFQVAAFALAGVVVNAFIAGGLSEVTGRYQLRVAWIPPVLAACLAVRLFRRVEIKS